MFGGGRARVSGPWGRDGAWRLHTEQPVRQPASLTVGGGHSTGVNIWGHTPWETALGYRVAQRAGTIIWDQRCPQQVTLARQSDLSWETHQPAVPRWWWRHSGLWGPKGGASESAVMLRGSFLKVDVPCRKGDVL